MGSFFSTCLDMVVRRFAICFFWEGGTLLDVEMGRFFVVVVAVNVVD